MYPEFRAPLWKLRPRFPLAVRRRLRANKEPSGKAPGKLDLLSRHLTNLGKLLASLWIVLATVLLVFHALAGWRQAELVIHPLSSVPSEMIESGFTGQFLAERLADRLEEIGDLSGSQLSNARVTPRLITDSALEEITVPGVSLSLHHLRRMILDALGRSYTSVSGSVTQTRDTINMHLNISGRGHEVIEIPLGDATFAQLTDDLLEQAARRIYRALQPYILATYLYDQDHAACEETIRYCLSHDPSSDDPWAYNLWGLLVHRQGESAEAERLFLQAITLEPCYSFAYSNWGIVLERRKDFTGASRKYLKAIECNPKNALAHHNLGVIFQKEERLEEASMQYQAAIEADPQFVDSYINLAAILWELGEREAALDTLGRANALFNRYDARVISNWGALLFRAGRYEEAAAKYELVRQTNPSSADLNCLVGLVYTRTKNDELAVKRFLRCGDLLLETGKAADAKEAYLRAEKIAPQSPEILKRLRDLGEVVETDRLTTDY